jgi:uncharacterized glyoxalase superfamily protein PhnB
MFPFVEAVDVAATVELYCRHLGFERVGSEPEEANGVFAVRSGPVHIAFIRAKAGHLPPFGEGVRLYLDVDDVEAHYAGALAGGVEIVSAPTEKPWRCREYTMRDPNGYVLTFSQPLG